MTNGQSSKSFLRFEESDLEVLLLFSGENERRGDLTREEPVYDGGGRPGF